MQEIGTALYVLLCAQVNPSEMSNSKQRMICCTGFHLIASHATIQWARFTDEAHMCLLSSFLLASKSHCCDHQISITNHISGDQPWWIKSALHEQMNTRLCPAATRTGQLMIGVASGGLDHKTRDDVTSCSVKVVHLSAGPVTMVH